MTSKDSVSKLLYHRAALTNIVRRMAVEAGDLILDYADVMTPGDVTRKADDSVLTDADRRAEDLIRARLMEAVPAVPVVGEEAVAAGAAPDVARSEYYWLVDALDGTQDYVAGGDEYTVNIALMKNHVPVIGVIYAPARGELYAGFTEEDGTQKAVRWHADQNTEKEIRVRETPRAGMTVVMSKAHKMDAALEAYLSQFKIEKVLKRGCSLKFCLLAAGKADLYPRFQSIHAWDIAAGHAILSAAGGHMTDLAGAPVAYGAGQGDFRAPPFIAAAFSLAEFS